MPASPVSCPECGAPAPFRGDAVSLVCEYCGSTLVRTGVDVSLVGKVSALLDTGSPILLGSAGALDGLTFEIVGRLQLRYRRGTWNEWYALFADGSSGWLADAQGCYSLLRPCAPALTPDDLPPFERLTLGSTVVVGGVRHVAVERRTAHYQGAEGLLPRVAAPGLTVRSVDLRGHHGEFLTLDFGEHDTRPGLFAGRARELAALALRPLRRFAGWPA